MTDIFASTDDVAPAAPAPAAAPAAPAPAVETAPPAAPARTPFDDQLDDFLSRDLLSEMDPQPATAPVVEGPAPAAQAATPGVAQPAPAGASPQAPQPAAPQAPQPAPANGGTPPATTTQAAPAGETATPGVDPDMLLSMFGTAPAAPAPTPAASPAPAAPVASADDEVPMPFTAAMQVPDALVQTIFESEDPVSRKQALVGLIAAIGNASVGYMEQRIKEFHAPRMASQFQATQVAQQQAAQVSQHFYGANPDLVNYRQVVLKAGEVYMAKNPTAVYNEETAANIAALARQAITSMGLPLQQQANGQPQAAPAAPASAPPVVPRTPYVAGGVSPGGNLDTPLDPNDAGSIFDQMSGGFA